MQLISLNQTKPNQISSQHYLTIWCCQCAFTTRVPCAQQDLHLTVQSCKNCDNLAQINNKLSLVYGKIFTTPGAFRRRPSNVLYNDASGVFFKMSPKTFKKGAIIFACTVCGDYEIISNVTKTSTILTSGCNFCKKFVPQSEETTFIADTSLFDIIGKYNPLSVAATNDLSNRTNSFKEWIMNGTSYGRSFISEYVHVPLTLDKHVNLIEDVIILMYSMLRSRSTLDRYVNVVAFCKMRGSRPGFTTMILYVLSDIFGTTMKKAYTEKSKLDKVYKETHGYVVDQLKYAPQAEEFELNDAEYENVFAQMRSYTSMYDKIKETTLYKKVYKFGLYLLTSGLLNNTNINFQSLGYDKFEKAAIERTHKPGINMVHCMIDTVLFVCDRGTQYFHTQNPDVLMSSGGSHEKWMARAQRLLRESKFLSNPEPHGINRFTFTSEIKDTIERGVSLVKYSTGLERSEKLYLQKTLNELQLIQANELTKQDSQKPRKAPFAVMIHGPSSICKSQLIRILFTHYGKCFSLPTNSEFMYTRCALDKFWSGQNSSQWCVVLDDVAYLKPNGTMDTSLGEVIMVNNSVPYNPPQAELEDKGRTPVKCDFLIGTTNTLDLNLHDYFSCPFAVARRFNLYITATVKKQFSKFTVMADSSLIPPTPEGEYMNIWDFTVSIAVPATDTHVDGQRAKYKILKRFGDVYDMLQYVMTIAKNHDEAQIKAKAADTTMNDVIICKKCFRPQQRCVCNDPNHRSGEDVDVQPINNFQELSMGVQENHFKKYVAAWSEHRKNHFPPNEIKCTWCHDRDEECYCFSSAPENDPEYLRFKARIASNDPSPSLCPECVFFQKDKCFHEYTYNINEDTLPSCVRDDLPVDYVFDQLFYVPQSEETDDRSSWWQSQFDSFDAWFDKPIFPISDEPIEPEPECKVTWLRYWLLSRIISQDTIDYDFEYTLKEIYTRYQKLVMPSVIALFYNYFFFMFLCCIIYFLFFIHKYTWVLSSYFYQYYYGDTWKYRLAFTLLGKESSAYIFIFKLAKRRIKKVITPFHLVRLMQFLLVLKISKNLWNWFSRPQGFTPQADVDAFSQGEAPKPAVEEKKPFYFHDPYVFTDVDITNQSKNCQPGVLENKVRRNTARFHFRWADNPGKTCSTTALNVHGQIWMFNAHVIKNVGVGTLNIILDPIIQNVSRNVTGIAIQQSDIIKFGTDSAFIRIHALPPGPSLYDYVAKKDRIPGKFNGEYHFINNEGIRSVRKVSNIRKGVCPFYRVPMYLGNVTTPTKNGDCGSACIMHAGTNRRVIIGVHTTGNDGEGVSINPISQRMLDTVLAMFPPQISSGIIELDAPGYPRELKPLHSKSTVRFIERGTAHIIGSFDGYRPQHKTRVKPTFIKDLVEKDGYVSDHSAPDMTWKPWYLGLSAMTQPNFNLQSQELDACIHAYTKDILKGLGQSIEELKPYNLNTALNGAEGVTYVDRINVRTSAGNPYKKSKLHFVTLDENNRIVEIDDGIAERMVRIEMAYRNKTRAHPQFCEHLKDEPLPARKCVSGATRLFSGAEFAWSIIVRRFLLPHIRLIQNNPLLFEAMPGVVAQSEEWQNLLEHLKEFGLNRIIGGDYEKFDKKMIALLVLGAFEILIAMCKAANWVESDINVVRGIAIDTAYSNIDFNGDLIEIQGNPSGHPLTVIINCLVNCLYMRFAYVRVTKKHPDTFKQNVRLVTYGDDNLMSVHPSCSEFNHTSIAEALSEIGVKYTMAEKGAESVPYISIDEASFLKRKFRFDEDIGATVAPLEHDSISKMLSTFVDNGTICAEAHSICVIETALREYFFYGKDKFEERRIYFMDLVKRAGLDLWVADSTFPMYYDLVNEFWMRTNNKEQADKYAPPEKRRVNSFNKSVAESHQLGTQNLVDGRKMSSTEHTCDRAPNDVSSENYASTPVGGPTIPPFVPIVQEVFNNSCVRECPANCSIEVNQSMGLSPNEANLFSDTTYKPQSEVIVDFVDESPAPATGIKAENNAFSTGDKTSSTELMQFLNRPVRIHSFMWQEADVPAIKVAIKPWYLWGSNPYILSKLNNYAFIRGNLKLKIQISASPFYYGCLMASYQPMQDFTPSTIVMDGATRHFIPYSQRPHVVIEPQHDDSYVLTLPFMWATNWLSVQLGSDWQSMGELTFLVYSALQSANGVSGSGVNVVTYAWMEDVELSGASVGYALQSDEYADGPVSKPASTIARFASQLSNVPIIGPFAKATSIGASAVSSIASLFGFTNVPVIEESKPVRTEAFPKFSSSEIGFPIEKLTLDPKNELSVDPRIVGLDGSDEMSLAYIAGKESFLTTATWSTADLIDQVLFYSRVNPRLYDNDGATTNLLYMTPMCYVSQLFNNWRGDIIFRFKIVCSKYHKGKLRISFDPSGYSAQNIGNTVTTSNVVHTAIVDIGQSDQIEFRVPYQQALHFLNVRTAITAAAKGWATRTAVPGTYPYDRLYDNGFIMVRVVNALTAPVSSSSVDIQVYVRAAENIQFANPCVVDPTSLMSLYAPQSEEFKHDGQTDHLAMGNTGSGKSSEYLVHYGENIRSLRQLLRRYEFVCRTYHTGSTSSLINCVDFHKMPPAPGYLSVAPWVATSILGAANANYNFTTMTMLSFTAPAFLAYRGSTNWSFNAVGNNLSYGIKSLRVVKDNVSDHDFGLRSILATTATASKVAAFAAFNTHPGTCGSALTNQLTNAGLNVQCPNMSPYKFQSTRPRNANVAQFYDGSLQDAFTLEVSIPHGMTGVTTEVDMYCAAGTDFGLHFFLNVPTFYIYATLPAGV